MRRHEHTGVGGDRVEIHSRNGEVRFVGVARAGEVDGDEVVVGVTGDPVAIGGGGAAEEHEVEIVQTFLCNRRDDCGFVPDLGQRAGGHFGRIEERDLRGGKVALAEERLQLVTDERQRVDDADTKAGGRLWVGHGRRVLSRGSRRVSSRKVSKELGREGFFLETFRL
jgi:hypothetical protein